MQFCKKRCKYCGKEYNYQASGYGCLNPYNDREYCEDCKRVMLHALWSLPVRYVAKYNDLPSWLDIQYQMLLPLKEQYIEYVNEHNFPIVLKVLPSVCTLDDNDTIQSNNDVFQEEYYYQGYDLVVSWKKTQPDNKTIKILSEYDTVENVFTGNLWILNEEKDRYCPLSTSPIHDEIRTKDQRHLGSILKYHPNDTAQILGKCLKDCSNNSLDKPIGKIFFNEFKFNSD